MNNEWTNVIASDYHSSDRVGRSMLADMQSPTPAHALEKWTARDMGWDSVTSKAAHDGSVFHAMILEPETAICLPGIGTDWASKKKGTGRSDYTCSDCGKAIPKGDAHYSSGTKRGCFACEKISTAAKEKMWELQGQYEYVIPEPLYDEGVNIINSLSETPCPGFDFSCLDMLREGDNELVGHAQIDGMNTQIRCDSIWRITQPANIFDLKIMGKHPTQEEIDRKIRFEISWILQPGMYSVVTEAITDCLPNWYWICVERSPMAPKSKRHAVAVHKATDAQMSEWRTLFADALARYKWCNDRNEFPCYEKTWNGRDYA